MWKRQLNPRAEARALDRQATARAATETLRRIDELEAIYELYGKDGPPDWANYVLRCYRPGCGAVVLFCDTVPFSPTGLSTLTCKVCKAKQPTTEMRRKYDPRFLVLIKDDVLNYLAKRKNAARATKE